MLGELPLTIRAELVEELSRVVRLAAGKYYLTGSNQFDFITDAETRPFHHTAQQGGPECEV